MFKFEDLSYVLDAVEKVFYAYDWCEGIGTSADRRILIIVKDPKDQYNIEELKKLIPSDLQKLLDKHQMKLFFTKVLGVDSKTGELIFEKDKVKIESDYN